MAAVLWKAAIRALTGCYRELCVQRQHGAGQIAAYAICQLFLRSRRVAEQVPRGVRNHQEAVVSMKALEKWMRLVNRLILSTELP
jgi:hypothetical protein